MKILVSVNSFAQFDSSVLLPLKGHRVIICNPYTRTLKAEEIRGFIVAYQPDALIAGNEVLDRTTLSLAKNLKIISRAGTGLDSIDLEAANDYGIKVVNAPDVCTQAVSELALALIFDCLRKVSYSDRQIRNGEWCKNTGYLILGKTIGIIGFGRIGSTLGRFAKDLGCRVIYYDPLEVQSSFAEPVSFRELLRTSDIISLNCPLQDNRHFIDEEAISLMKDGAILINTARGALVDYDALYDALEAGKLFAAGIDVFEEEPYSGKLTDLDNVILTSHMGSYTFESRVEMEIEAIKNLLK